MFDRQRKYAIRKIAVGTISAVIGTFMVGSTDVSAKEVSIDYKYVTLNELTEDEKKLIKTNQHELVAKEDKVYYMVYRPVNSLPSTSATGSADNMIGAALAGGAVLLLAAVSVGKNRRKRLTSLIVLTTAGTSIIAPNAFAIENKELLRYNQELSLTVDADLPDPLKIDGYEFVGYICAEKEVKKEALTPKKVEEKQVETTQAPVAKVTPVTPVKPGEVVTRKGTRLVQEAKPEAQIVTEAPATKIVTEAPATKVVTEAPVTKVVTEAPVTKVVTEAPVTRVITEAPVTRVITEAPVTRVVTQQPAPIVVSNDETTQVVTQAPIVQVITEAPVTRVVTEAPVTKVVTEAPVTKVVTEAPVTKVVTEKPTENLVIEEKPELKVVQGTEERIVETQNIPFSTRYEEDANLWEGETQVVTPGTQGQKEIVDTYPTVNGLIVANPERTERVVKDASEQVEKRGTKPVQGQVEEVVTTSVERKTQYVEDLNAEVNTKTTLTEGRDEVKEIHNLYETIKGEKTKLISTSERAIITSENKVIAVGIKPTERTEITAKHSVIYQEDPAMAHTAEPVTKQEGKDEITKYKTTYILDKLSGNVTANPETSEKTQDRQDMIVVVGTLPTTRTETRKYSIEYKSSDQLEVGQEQIETPGKDGSVLFTTTYTLDQTTGKAVANPETEEVKEAVVNQVILVGTKPRVVTRTINYKMEDGSSAPESKVQTVEFTKEILSTDPATGLRTYSDWKSANDKFASLASPEVAKYTADIKTVEEKTVTADSQNETVEVLYKVNILETEDKRVVKRTINYLYEEDRSKALEPEIQELTYTRAKFTNEVTGEVKYGDWNLATQDFAEKISPEIDGYTVDIEKVDLLTTNPDTKDVEVTVLYSDKFIEVKDVDTASLYVSEGTIGYSRVMALDSVPADTSKYYVKVKSDQFKDLQLSVKSITEETRDGKPVYKVVTTHPKMKQDENYNGYDADYTIYVAKTDGLPGVKTFRELLDKVKANPAENIVLANDISAEGYDLSVKDVAYITEKFAGTLSGKNGDKNFAIYDLKAPLFATLAKGSTVSDIALKNVDIDANHYEKVGALAGRAEGSMIKNVVVQGEVAASNNYGTPDTNSTGPGKIILGGLVAEAVEGTTLDSNTFVGKINGDSTGIRYWAGNGAYTELHLGGLAGVVLNNSKLINNRVSADIHINAVDGVAVANDPGLNYVRNPLGHPLYAGGLAGVVGNDTHTGNYVEGTIVNQLENNTTTYVDGIDRNQFTGFVGGLFGNISNSRAVENIAAMKVTNGALVNMQGQQLNQKVVEGVASGDKNNQGATTPVTVADVAAKKDAIKTALELSNQYITNEFDVDYTQVKGYNPAYAKAYANMEKLLPFYNRAFIVAEANKLAATDKLVTDKLLSVTPMKDSVIVSDVSGDKEAINKLLLHFENSIVEYRDVKYKEDFKDTKVAEYTLAGSNVAYTTDQFIGSYDAVVAAVKDELSSLVYTGAEVIQALDTAATLTADSVKLLYLEEKFDEIKTNIESVLKNVLGTSVAYSNTNDVVEYIKKNKAELLLGLSYISKWYNIDFDKMNVQNLITYQPDFFGKQVSTLEWLVEVGSAGYRALDPKVNDEKAASLVGENNDTESLHDILESYRKVFAKDMSFEEWFKSSIKAYVATGKAIDDVTGKEIGNSDVYHQLSRRVAGVAWNRGAGTIDFSNTILPLLSARQDRVYIISTGSSLQFGALHTYVDPTLEKTNPEAYKAELEKVKANIEKIAHNQARHWEAWYAIANENVQDKLVSNKPVFDTLFVKTATGRVWPEKFGPNAPEAVLDFFGPLGRIGNAPGGGQEAWSDGTNVGFTGVSALNMDGESIWTHEQAHNWDGSVYLGGHGRRAGANMELYAEGLLQAPRAGRIRNSFGLNMVFDNTQETNPFPEYNASPERFQNASELQEYVRGMMDTLYVLDYAEAMAVSELSSAVQANLLAKMTAVAKNATVNLDRFTALTEEQVKAMNLKDINTFVDENIARSYKGVADGDSSVTHYRTVSMFTPFYGLEQNDNGISGMFTFKRTAFELLAEFGYQGFVDYASGRYKTDKEAVTAIFNGKYTDLKHFKKEMFADRIAKVGTLQGVTFIANGTQYDIKNFEELQKAMNTVVATGNGDRISEFKKQAFIAYKNLTKEFETSIF